MHPPWHSGVKISNTDTSKAIEVLAMIRCPIMVTALAAGLMKLTTQRWVMATALGSPVDPEV